jgi:hypothetical protein
MLRLDCSVKMEPQTEGNHLTIRTIHDLREVENLREIWKTWQKTRDSDLDFFAGMVRSRGDGCRPHVLVLIRNGRPDALLVGLSDRTRVSLRVGSMTICRPAVSMLEFVYGGLLGNASWKNCAALVRAVMRSLADGDADVAVWDRLDVHSTLYTCALKLPSLLLRHYSRCRDHWSMNFPKDLDAFLLSLGPKQRSKLRRKYKKVLRGFVGRMQVRSYQTIADLEHAIPDMEEIASKSVKRQLGFGFFDTPQSREQLLIEATRGSLRIYILYLNENPVAFWKGTLYEHCLHADHAGFHSAWSSYSPGIFLFLNILEKFRGENIKTIDFGCGDGQFHQRFGNIGQPEARVQICAPKFSALQFHLLVTLVDYANTLIRTPFLNWARKAVRKKRQAAALSRLAGGQIVPHCGPTINS